MLIFRIGPAVSWGCKHSLDSVLGMQIQGFHQNSGLLFTLNPLSSPGLACPAGPRSGDSGENLASSMVFPLGLPSQLPWLQLCYSMGAGGEGAATAGS